MGRTETFEVLINTEKLKGLRTLVISIKHLQIQFGTCSLGFDMNLAKKNNRFIVENELKQ